MPVFGEPVLDYRSLHLGDAIRRLRKERGWMIRTAASRLGISVANLSAIENDRAILDVEQLAAFADVFGVRLDTLLPRTQSRHFHIVRHLAVQALPAERLKTVSRDGRSTSVGHNLIRPLAEPFVGKHIEPYHISIPPSDDHLQFISHHDEEFFFVLRGQVELQLSTLDEMLVEVLGPGDCVYFRSDLPHSLRALGSDTAEAIQVLEMGYGTTDSAQTHVRMYPGDRLPRKALPEQVASKIAALRQHESVTAAELAAALGIRVRRLAEIEEGRRPISLELLLNVSAYFRKPVEYFLSSAFVEPPFASVMRASDIGRLPLTKLRRLPDGDPLRHEFRSLVSGFGARAMFPYYINLRCSPDLTVSLHDHHGQEFVYVLNGEVTLLTIVDGERVSYRLLPGDMCFIDSTVPHRFIGMGGSPYARSQAEVIDVYWCSLGEDYLFVDPQVGTSLASVNPCDPKYAASDKITAPPR